MNRALSGERMTGRQKYLEGLLHKRLELQFGTAIFLSKKSYIDAAMQQRCGKLRRVLGRDHHMNIWQFIAKKL